MSSERATQFKLFNYHTLSNIQPNSTYSYYYALIAGCKITNGEDQVKQEVVWSVMGDITKGCPQGGALSPVLWSLVMDTNKADYCLCGQW